MWRCIVSIKLINPLTDIREEDLPLIVLSDDMLSFLGWAIRSHQSNIYNHAMIMHRVGFVASQEYLYKERPIEYFMKPRYRLKLWKYTLMTQEDRINITNAVYNKLSAPWYNRMYDYIGILGQAIHLNKLNNPFKNYCSEDVADKFRLVPALKNIMPEHPSPSEINKFCELNSYFQCLGICITEE